MSIARVRAWWKKRNLAPPHVIAWRLIWILPTQAARALFVAVVFCSRGIDSAERAWANTR